ncbi:MAG TPA: ferrochelatase [Aliiroseovarius sp.]|nr:ferrochelatase [Aliiroseovarius sp.]
MKTTSQHAFQGKARTGLLLINLGTPDGTDEISMRRYLKQFLSDKRVIDASGPLWWLILNGIILRKKPKSSGAAYARIWNNDRNESPMRTITRAQADALAQRLESAGVVVDWAMRYGVPSIRDGLEGLTAKGCDRILIFPLYPQYAGGTTGTAMDAVFEVLKGQQAQPAIRQVPAYYDHPGYVAALAESIGAHHASLGWAPEVTLASFHGLPVDFIQKGDPYQAQCEATYHLLQKALGVDESRLQLTYQSRTGRKEWTGPDTEETLVDLAKHGVKSVSVIAPGFAADGVETLEELGLRARDAFLGAGGENFTLVPCLNASNVSMDLMETLARENLCGWV